MVCERDRSMHRRLSNRHQIESAGLVLEGLLALRPIESLKLAHSSRSI